MHAQIEREPIFKSFTTYQALQDEALILRTLALTCMNDEREVLDDVKLFTAFKKDNIPMTADLYLSDHGNIA